MNYKNNLLLRSAEAVGISFTSPSVVDINSTDNLILSIGEKMNYSNLPSNLQNYTTNQKRELVKRFFEELNPLLKTRPLCFTAEEAKSTVKMIKANEAPTVYLETSTTGEEGSWSEYKIGSIIVLPNVGDKVYFRAKQDNERFSQDSDNSNRFVMTGKIEASGNLNTLLKADGSVIDLTGRDYCYNRMFFNCSSLTKAPELPAMTLADQCYVSMFYGCTSLTQAPELPATTLADYCYYYMFLGCTSLTQAPELPATTLADGCYEYMFAYCTSLTKAPELPATALVDYCYSRMFSYCSKLNSINVNFSAWNPINATTNWISGVASPGTFICPTSLSETRGASNIPYGWTVVRK